MLRDHGERRQQCQRIERRDRGAALLRLHRHVEHGQMVGHEESVELAALQRLRQAAKMLEIEIRIRPRTRVTPGCGVDANRPHESTKVQLT
jgi:hypothetical protein